MKKQDNSMTKQDIIDSLKKSCKEMNDKFLITQKNLNESSEMTNRYIDGANRSPDSWGVCINRDAVKLQTSFLAGMIVGIKQVLNDIDDIESVMMEES